MDVKWLWCVVCGLWVGMLCGDVQEVKACSPAPEEEGCERPRVWVDRVETLHPALFNTIDLQSYTETYDHERMVIKVHSESAPEGFRCDWQLHEDDRLVTFVADSLEGEEDTYTLAPASNGFQQDKTYTVSVPYQCKGKLDFVTKAFRTTRQQDDAVDELSFDVSLVETNVLAKQLFTPWSNGYWGGACDSNFPYVDAPREVLELDTAMALISYDLENVEPVVGLQHVEIIDPVSGEVLRNVPNAGAGTVAIYAPCEPIEARKYLYLGLDPQQFSFLWQESKTSHFDEKIWDVRFTSPQKKELLVRATTMRGINGIPQVQERMIEVDLQCHGTPAALDASQMKEEAYVYGVRVERSQEAQSSIELEHSVPEECHVGFGQGPGGCAQTSGSHHVPQDRSPLAALMVLLVGGILARYRSKH